MGILPSRLMKRCEVVAKIIRAFDFTKDTSRLLVEVVLPGISIFGVAGQGQLIPTAMPAGEGVAGIDRSVREGA